jgi:hypothetical protein
MTFSLGADPEFFIETPDGKLRSIVGLLGGSKENPKSIDDNGAFCIQEDNVAAEYNIPPSYSKEQFIQHIQWPQEYIAHLLGTDKFTISRKASGSFDPAQLNNKQAQQFGCDPDYNAWTLEENPKPKSKDKTFRTCGGHVHIGLDDKDPMNVVRLIRAMDKHLGVWSVLADKDDKRRELYGKAGAFRPQPHGCEYRTLSNFWIFSPELISEVWDRTKEAMNEPLIGDKEGKEIQHIINTGDKEHAKTYCRTCRI